MVIGVVTKQARDLGCGLLGQFTSELVHGLIEVEPIACQARDELGGRNTRAAQQVCCHHLHRPTRAEASGVQFLGRQPFDEVTERESFGVDVLPTVVSVV